jgi:hypothetical protein
MTDGERRGGFGGTIVRVSVALLPLRPRVAEWLLWREPAFIELRLAARFVRVVAWPELALLLMGAAGGTALALEVDAFRRRRHYASALQAPTASTAKPAGARIVTSPSGS